MSGVELPLLYRSYTLRNSLALLKPIMKKPSHALLIGAAIGLLTLQAGAAETNALPRAVSASDKSAYVQASLARVRAAPDTDAKTLAQVVTNTPVKLLAVREDWCELEVAGQNALPQQEQNLHGFIACRLLSVEPLTLAKVEAQIANAELDARELLNWQSRAFWIAPSLTRWAAVGKALEKLYLDESTHFKEIEAMRPLRFKVQEFEAMKQRLAAGITVTPESYQEMLRQSYQAMKQPMSFHDLHIKGALEFLSPIDKAHSRVKFPQIKPSHFRKHEIPVILPRAEFPPSNFWLLLVDALSAYNGASFQAEVIAPAVYEPLMADDFGGAFVKVHALDEILGIWDVGGLRVTFTHDALLYGITLNGEPTAWNLKATRLCMGYNLDESNSSCDNNGDMGLGWWSLSGLTTKAPVAGYTTHVPTLVRWIGKPMPSGAIAKAQIKTRHLSGTDENNAITVHEIDLNRDGVADLLMARGNADGTDSGMVGWESIFANIDGQWLLLQFNEAEGEGC
ncbi:hypothetical protein FACS189441_4550 [Betaproteobacteria bacterium]|nr:hypothetical protein FACS189441_4550 [Betaproteobacteria bacterium]